MDVVSAPAILRALKPQDDENLPLWLASMIVYLRKVSDDVAWQNLVTGFVDFEKRGPPSGVSRINCVIFMLIHHHIESSNCDATDRGVELDKE